MANVNFITNNDPLEVSVCRPHEEQLETQEELIVVVQFICEYQSGTIDNPDTLELTELMVNRTIERSDEMSYLAYANMEKEDPDLPQLDKAFHLDMFARGVEHAHQLLTSGLLHTSRGKQIQVAGTIMRHLLGVSRNIDGNYHYVSITVVTGDTGTEYFGHNAKMDLLKIAHFDNSITHML